jgi:hypothetical protein
MILLGITMERDLIERKLPKRGLKKALRQKQLNNVII